MLTGFYITSSNFYMVNVTGSLVSSLNYEIKVSTTSDSIVHRVDLYVLICQLDGLTTNGYYYFGGEMQIYSN